MKAKKITGLLVALIMTLSTVLIPQTVSADAGIKTLYEASNISGAKSVNLDDLGFVSGGKYQIETTVIPKATTGWHWAYIDLENTSFSVHEWNLATFIDGGYYFNGNWKSSVGSNVTTPALKEGITFKMVWDTAAGTATVTAGNSGWTFPTQTWNPGTLPEGGSFGNFKVASSSTGYTVKSIVIKDIDYQTDSMYEASNISGKASVNLDAIGFVSGGVYEMETTVIPAKATEWHWAYIDLENTSFTVHEWMLATFINDGYYINGAWKSSVGSNVTTPALTEGITFKIIWDTAAGTAKITTGNSGWTYDVQTWNSGVLPEGGKFGNFVVGGNGAVIKSVSIKEIVEEPNVLVDYEESDISGTTRINLDELGFRSDEKYVIEATVLPTAATGWPWAYMTVEKSSFSAHSWGLASFINDGFYFNGSWKSSVSSNVTTPALTEGIKFTMVWDAAAGTAQITAGNSGWTFPTQNWNPGVLPEGGKFGDLVVGGVSCTVKSISIKECVEITASAEGYGKVSGGGSYKANETVTLSATPLTGCTFEGWYKDGKLVSTDAELSFVAEGNSEYVAKFSGEPQHNIFKLEGYEYNEDFAKMTQADYELMPWADAKKASFDEANDRIVINPGTNLALDLDELGIDEKGIYEIRVGLKGGAETPTTTAVAWNTYFDGGQELLAEYWETSGGIAGNVNQRANRLFGTWKAIYGSDHHSWDFIIRWNTQTGEMTVKALDVTNQWTTTGDKTIATYKKGEFPNLYLNAGFETLYVDYVSVKYIPADMDIASNDVKVYANDTLQANWNSLSSETNKIVIDFGAVLADATGITLTNSNGEAVAFEGTADGDAYVLSIKDGLVPGAYTLKIDTTVADVMGETVKQEFTAKLNVCAAKVGATATVLDANGNETADLASATQIKLDYVNNTGNAQTINVIEKYYNGTALVSTQFKAYNMPGTVTEETINHPVNMPNVEFDKAKVMLWNDFELMGSISDFIELSVAE